MSSIIDNSRTVILDFYDSCLRQSDVSLLDGPFWLNDEIIAFAYEYFLRRHFVDQVDKIGFISPSVVQLTKFLDVSALVSVLEELKLRNKELLFFPVNNNQSNNTAGGSHWSLLVFRRKDDTFYHFDSSSSSNIYVARSIAERISAIVGHQKALVTVVTVPVSFQQNGYDCGVFCILFTEKLAETYCRSSEGEFPDLTTITSTDVSNYRQNLQSIIDKLRAESGDKDKASCWVALKPATVS